jgi:putative addiction module component (TIGR02574 family)
VTLAAVKKLAVSLPLKQRLQLADALYGSLPPLRGSVGIAELERRADEVESGKVKALKADVVLAELELLVRAKTHKRRRQRD